MNRQSIEHMENSISSVNLISYICVCHLLIMIHGEDNAGNICIYILYFLVLDKGPSGLKVLVPNKYQCKKKPFTAV